MKLWRKMGNKITIRVGHEEVRLTGRQFKYRQQLLTSQVKPASNLLIALINRI